MSTDFPQAPHSASLSWQTIKTSHVDVPNSKKRCNNSPNRAWPWEHWKAVSEVVKTAHIVTMAISTTNTALSARLHNLTSRWLRVVLIWIEALVLSPSMRMPRCIEIIVVLSCQEDIADDGTLAFTVASLCESRFRFRFCFRFFHPSNFDFDVVLRDYMYDYQYCDLSIYYAFIHSLMSPTE